MPVAPIFTSGLAKSAYNDDEDEEGDHGVGDEGVERPVDPAQHNYQP
jgi:hypothetical protein